MPHNTTLTAVTTSKDVVQGAELAGLRSRLRRRGSLTLWIEDAALECWQTIGLSGRARSTGAASQTSLMPRAQFKLALQQIEGLMMSVLSLMGLMISAPDHTTVSRRAVTLPVIQAPSVPMVRCTY
jgi:hypothetical protein